MVVAAQATQLAQVGDMHPGVLLKQTIAPCVRLGDTAPVQGVHPSRQHAPPAVQGHGLVAV